MWQCILETKKSTALHQHGNTGSVIWRVRAYCCLPAASWQCLQIVYISAKCRQKRTRKDAPPFCFSCVHPPKGPANMPSCACPRKRKNAHELAPWNLSSSLPSCPLFLFSYFSPLFYLAIIRMTCVCRIHTWRKLNRCGDGGCGNTTCASIRTVCREDWWHLVLDACCWGR